MRKWIWALLLLCAIPFCSEGAELYKWVDENGVVHFSDRPPPDRQSEGVDVLEMEQNPGSEAGESVYNEVIRQQQARREERAASKEREAQEREAESGQTAMAEAVCARAIHYLNTLQKQCPVFYDGAGILRGQCPGYYYLYEGERTYVDDREREKLIEHYGRIVLECAERYP